ncbi:MAG: hypothetical protein Tsb0034_26850 [Ekhidna sp.]
MKKADLGKKLHDGIAQKLTAANMNLLYLSKSGRAKEEELHELLQETIDLLEQSIKETREISHELMNDEAD